MHRTITLATLIVTGLAGCATPYRETNPLVEAFTTPGGYSNQELSPKIWRITFTGNAKTSRETLQTYWLYRAAELALENKADGFEILSSPPLVQDGDAAPLQLAATAAPIIVPMYTAPATRVDFTGNILLLSKPITPAAGKIYDATALKAVLDPYVNGLKCGTNVCPHDHKYLRAVVTPGA